jgi:pheromone shutdown protein TraB
MQDVWRVIRSTKPTVAMIELDEERLNRMRQVPRVQQMTPEQLQQARVTGIPETSILWIQLWQDSPIEARLNWCDP